MSRKRQRIDSSNDNAYYYPGISHMEACRWHNHAEYLTKQKEAELMAKGKRPPVKGNIRNTTGMSLRIFFNQKEVKEIIEYDTEAGIIVRYKTDKLGKPIIKNDAFVTETLCGSVLVQRIK